MKFVLHSVTTHNLIVLVGSLRVLWKIKRSWLPEMVLLCIGTTLFVLRFYLEHFLIGKHCC